MSLRKEFLYGVILPSVLLSTSVVAAESGSGDLSPPSTAALKVMSKSAAPLRRAKGVVAAEASGDEAEEYLKRKKLPQRAEEEEDDGGKKAVKKKISRREEQRDDVLSRLEKKKKAPVKIVEKKTEDSGSENEEDLPDTWTGGMPVVGGSDDEVAADETLAVAPQTFSVSAGSSALPKVKQKKIVRQDDLGGDDEDFRRAPTHDSRRLATHHDHDHHRGRDVFAMLASMSGHGRSTHSHPHDHDGSFERADKHKGGKPRPAHTDSAPADSVALPSLVGVLSQIAAGQDTTNKLAAEQLEASKETNRLLGLMTLAAKPAALASSS